MTGLSLETGASGKFDAMFSCHDVFSDLQTQQVLGNHFLMETRIICLIKQDLNEHVRQEHQGRSLNNCIDELQQQAYAQRLELGNAHDGILSLDNSKQDYKKN